MRGTWKAMGNLFSRSSSSGTTLTQAAALYAENGAGFARSFYADVAARGVQVVDGNSVVRDLVADGHAAWGLTDTDDACSALLRGDPVDVIFPDQGLGQIGTLIVPNTVALVANGPHPEEGQDLIDFLLGSEAEALLVESGWIQIPSRALAGDVIPVCFAGADVRGMDTGLEDIYHNLAVAQDDLHAIFVH